MTADAARTDMHGARQGAAMAAVRVVRRLREAGDWQREMEGILETLCRTMECQRGILFRLRELPGQGFAQSVAAYWIDRIERLLRACVRDRDRLPAERSLDVLFHEFMADDVGMVERIYGIAGLPMTAPARRELDAYMAANPRGKHGQVVYDLPRDFGLDPAEVRERFAFYFERFPVKAEG